jgi:hypothetical protein
LPKIPGVNHLDAVRAFEKAGFRIVRQGKHIVMRDARYVTSISQLGRLQPRLRTAHRLEASATAS